MEARKKNTLCLSPTQEFRVGKPRIGCLDFRILKGCPFSTAEGDHPGWLPGRWCSGHKWKTTVSTASLDQGEIREQMASFL